MKMLSAGFLVLAFLMALVYGPQTAEWSWGPAFIALGLAVGAGCFGPSGSRYGIAVRIAMLPAIGWILLRCFQSPVMDPARGDAMLVLAVFGTSVVVAGLVEDRRALWILFGGLSVLSLLNLGIALIQIETPDFMWPYANRPVKGPTGFFGHYNYFANFTLGVALLLASRGLFSKDHPLLKVLYGVTFAGSLAMVAVVGSRGGTVALGFGVLLLLGALGAVAWRRNVWWSKVVLVLFPILLIGGAVAGWSVLKKVQQQRGKQSMLQMLDNTSRLEWMNLALEVASEHPVAGGGSRSYSWERNRHWDVKEFGRGSENERFVHNELLQTITDYGLVGAVLVLVPIGVLGWLAVSNLFLGSSRDPAEADAVAAGVLSAGGAMLAQANVSFVFHLLPSALLLGLLFGLGSMLQSSKEVRSSAHWARIGIGAVLMIPLLWLGFRGTSTLRAVWPVLYMNPPQILNSPAVAMANLDSAIESWPGDRLLEVKASNARIAASAPGIEPAERSRWNRIAAESYRAAADYHPYHPGLVINLANTLSDLGRNAEAEVAYLKAIELQGGLEDGFGSRFHYAKHLYALWYGRWVDPDQRRAGEALWQFRKALKLLDDAKEQQGGYADGVKQLRVRLEEAIAFLEGARVEAVEPPPEELND
ncbi:O-antigenpolymerase protein [Haloferula helveola]|uniref:O-antigenpolymerase protein n=1 Tax=Haloferula helveola TaxID=490095 RepID=A0ABM7RF38_9BACT|nr:O-antigenpolymerase protein [Haloferula helveola]